mgnify:CR=1 FL=1
MGLVVKNIWDGEYLLITNPITRESTKIRTYVSDKEAIVQKERLNNFVRSQMTDEKADRILKSSQGGAPADNL